MLSPDGIQAYIAVEGARMRPFTPATSANDSPLFSTWVYGPSEPDGVLASRVNRPQERFAQPITLTGCHYSTCDVSLSLSRLAQRLAMKLKSTSSAFSLGVTTLLASSVAENITS
ncbi:hypothetical protein LB505_009277 [Fusarium chuoi]|nr:hypothetical protein LB505_009277 [Fusarium chuoi]